MIAALEIPADIDLKLFSRFLAQSGINHRISEAGVNQVIWVASEAERAQVLRRVADLYEAHFAEFFALITREAGKTTLDAVAELREAVDFLRYYAARAAERLQRLPALLP